jgi:hypothetical protein
MDARVFGSRHRYVPTPKVRAPVFCSCPNPYRGIGVKLLRPTRISKMPSMMTRRRGTRRTGATRPGKRRTRLERRSLPRTVTRSPRKWASTCSTSVNIIWRGACISPPSAAWAISARRNSRQPLEATPPPMPLLPPLSPTLNSKPSLPACRGGSMRTDGARQHAYGIC